MVIYQYSIIHKYIDALLIHIFEDPSPEFTAILEVNLEEQTIIISLYDELDNIERKVFDCRPFTKETLIRLTEEYQRGSGVYNTSLFLLTNRKYLYIII